MFDGMNNDDELNTSINNDNGTTDDLELNINDNIDGRGTMDNAYTFNYNTTSDSNIYNHNQDNNDGDKARKKKTVIIFSICSAAVVIFIILMAVGISALTKGKDRHTEASKFTLSPANGNASVETSEDNSSAELTNNTSNNDGDSVADVVENVMPSIVTINCVAVSTITDFWGRPYEEESSGSGSGIIIGQSDNQILVVTNNHVVDGAEVVSVVFCDDEEVEAKVKGTDSYSDLAILAINTSNIKPSTLDKIKTASLGNSDECKVGQMAIAIGNALGYGQSVTVGIISALNRQVSIEDYSMTLIQTDAAINPGNSGGALINTKGEVIGINSVKYVSEDTEGMGYAIPISSAIPIINDLMNYEEIDDEKRGYLGIIGQDLSEENAKKYNAVAGVVIQEVSENSPAAAAGLVRGDIIVKFDGRSVTSMQQIQEILSKKEGNTQCELVIYRYSEGKYSEKSVTVTLGYRVDFEN